MAILRLCYQDNPVLRQQARPITRVTKKIRKLMADMLETMYDANGVGLAAPQVGESIRVIVVDVGEQPLLLANPELVETSQEQSTDAEGCLSIPGVQGYVTRPAQVVVKGINQDGKPVKIEAQGLLARALQHEIDHLNGVLFIDRAAGVTREE